MSNPPLAAADPDLVELVREALRRSTKPLKAAAIKKALPKPHQKAWSPAILDELAATGRIVSYEKGGKNVGYGLRDLAELSREAILEAVGDEPQAWTALKKHPAIKTVSGLRTAKELDAVREGLVASGRLYEWPKTGAKGSAPRYGKRPAAARALLDESSAFEKTRQKFIDDLKKLAKGFERAGVTEDEVIRAALAMLPSFGVPVPLSPPPTREEAPYEPRLATLILDCMIDEEPAAASGAPVSIRNLRRAMGFHLPGKQEFDEVVKAMADEGVLALHRHDFPGSLTETERDELVPDGRGGYHIAVSRRS